MREKNRESGFRTLLEGEGITFRGLHVQYLKEHKNEIHMVVFVTLFATDINEVHQCKKGNKFLLDFLLEGVCFHRI